MSLERFIKAQQTDYAKALGELRNGAKKSHWIWYVLPQGLFPNPSYMSEKFAIKDDAEAVAYLRHPVLGRRYAECIDVIHAQILKHGVDAEVLMGSDVDAKKLQSSLTLMLKVIKSAPMKGAKVECPWLSKLRSQARKLIPTLPKF